MINVEFFTSMNKEYFNHCGKAMLESFIKCYRKKQINLYNEDNFQPMMEKVKLKGWNLGFQYNDFQERWKNDNKRVKQFAKKGFSIIHAMNTISADRIVWLDADTIIKAPFHPHLIEILCPSNVLSVHLGVHHAVGDKKYFSCETGFFILNKTHPMFKRFKSVYADIYFNDKKDDLRRFYDGEVYGKTVEILQAEGAEMLDLNPEQRHKTPIPRSLLAPYISHNKAGIKDDLTNEILEEIYSLKE